MDESIKHAVYMEIVHIEELYGSEGLVYAKELLKEMIDGHDTNKKREH
jgi:hypothetical protein